jgi:hypothetical protein
VNRDDRLAAWRPINPEDPAPIGADKTETADESDAASLFANRKCGRRRDSEGREAEPLSPPRRSVVPPQAPTPLEAAERAVARLAAASAARPLEFLDAPTAAIQDSP